MNNENNRHINHNNDNTTTIPDHSVKGSDQTCIVYKFQSRPPYEGFILILVIVIISILLIWWLSQSFKAAEQ
jgi:hypothetical protein